MEGGKDGGRLNGGVTGVIMCHSEQEHRDHSLQREEH